MKKTLIALIAILAAAQTTNAANRGANWISVPMIAHYATYDDFLKSEYKRHACPQKAWDSLTKEERLDFVCEKVHTNDQNGTTKKYYLEKIKKDQADGTTDAYYKAFPKLKRPPTPTE